MKRGEGRGLAEMLRARRLELGWSVREAAAQAGISKSLISALETGARRDPQAATLRALAHAYGLSAEDLLAEQVGDIPPALSDAMALQILDEPDADELRRLVVLEEYLGRECDQWDYVHALALMRRRPDIR